MTREEIGLAALEAGFMLSTAHGQNTHQLMPVSDLSTLERFAELVAAAEREECAKVCETQQSKLYMQDAGIIKCADAIRARGNK